MSLLLTAESDHRTAFFMLIFVFAYLDLYVYLGRYSSR